MLAQPLAFPVFNDSRSISHYGVETTGSKTTRQFTYKLFSGPLRFHHCQQIKNKMFLYTNVAVLPNTCGANVLQTYTTAQL